MVGTRRCNSLRGRRKSFTKRRSSLSKKKKKQKKKSKKGGMDKNNFSFIEEKHIQAQEDFEKSGFSMSPFVLFVWKLLQIHEKSNNPPIQLIPSSSYLAIKMEKIYIEKLFPFNRETVYSLFENHGFKFEMNDDAHDTFFHLAFEISSFVSLVDKVKMLASIGPNKPQQYLFRSRQMCPFDLVSQHVMRLAMSLSLRPQVQFLRVVTLLFRPDQDQMLLLPR
jgi:hypothetical protein